MIKKDYLIDKILELDAAKFQKVCDDYFRENGYPSIVSFGLTIRGIKTKKGTPDSHSLNKDGTYTFFEYSTEQGNIGKKLNKDVDLCLEYINKVNNSEADFPFSCRNIIFVASSNDLSVSDHNNAKSKCMDAGISLKVICLNELCNKLLKNGKSVIRDDLGISLEPSPICDCDEFIARNKNRYGCDFSKPIIGRDKDIDELSNAIASFDIVVVTGDSGVGKTRLVLESLRKIKKDVIVVENRVGDIFGDLSLALANNKQNIVFFDDANSVAHLEQCVQTALGANEKTKFVLTVRSYAKAKICEIVKQFKLKNHYYVVNRITPVDIKGIIETNYGIVNLDYQDRIIRISNGNARLAVIACEQVICSQGSSAFLWNDSASLLSSYYHDVISNKEGLDYEKKRDLLGILSTLKKFDIDDESIISKINELTGFSPRDIKLGYRELYKLEIVDIYMDRVVSVSDQCLEDYFAYETYIESKSIAIKDVVDAFFDIFDNQIVDTINSIVCIYTSQSGNEYVKKQVIDVWNHLEYNNKLSTRFVSAFALVDGKRATKWCANHMFAGKTKTDERLISNPNGGYCNRDEYLSILEHVFNNEKDGASISYILDSLSYSELREQALDIVKRTMTLQPEDFKDEFARQNMLIESLKNYSKEKWFGTLVCAACKELLRFNYTFTKYSKKDSLQYCSFNLSDEYSFCNSIRNKAWKLLHLINKNDTYHFIYDYFNAFPDSATNIFLNDIDNINAIFTKYGKHKNPNELLIYGRSFFHFYSIGNKWKYMEKKYADEKDDIILLLNPREDDASSSERKSKWELKVEKRAKNDEPAKSIELISKAVALLELVDESKIKTFICTYLSYNCNEMVTNWSFDNVQKMTEKLNERWIYLLAEKIKSIDDLYERVESMPSDFYKKELIAAYLLLTEDKMSHSKDLLGLLFQYDFSMPNNSVLIHRRIDLVKKISDDDNEFVSYLNTINNNYISNPTICNEYYSILFNPYVFKKEDLFEIFKNRIQILECAFLNHLPCRSFNYKPSEYYFMLCDKDSSFFDNTIETVMSNEENIKAIELLWKQKNCCKYASTIFEIAIEKAENNFACRMNFAHYFALGAHSNSNKNDETIFHWAVKMVEDPSCSKRIEFLSKIVAETNSKFVIKFVSYLINIGINLDLFKSLWLEPQIVSYSGSAVPYMKQKIDFYNEILSNIENKTSSREIVNAIEERVENILNCIEQTKIDETLDYRQ